QRGRPALRCALCRLRSHPAPFCDQRFAIELAARVLRQLRAQQDLLWCFECRKLRGTIAHEIVGYEGLAGTQHHIAYHFFTAPVVRASDGGSLADFGALHQDAVDLHRRDVDAAPDNEILLAPGQMQAPVGIEEADIAGSFPAATVHAYSAVGTKIAV